MRTVTTKELSAFKILPFDLYDESNNRVLTAGEALTPGKLIMLKNYVTLYTEEVHNDYISSEDDNSSENDSKKLSSFTYDNIDISDFFNEANYSFVFSCKFITNIFRIIC